MMRYTASALGQWSKELIEAAAKSDMDGCDLSIKVWRLGNVALYFVAAEVFVETAVAIRDQFWMLFLGGGWNNWPHSGVSSKGVHTVTLVIKVVRSVNPLCF